MNNLETKRFHSLELLRYCGGGAYGNVYFSKDISGRELAVKIVSKQKLGDSWQRELQGVINYRKITEKEPDLLPIYHVEETEDTFFYTMEPADSCLEEEYKPDTLTQRLQNGSIPQDQLLPIIRGIFTGIEAIHRAGFAHRDIKPDNILFVKGKPKLADIGLLSSLTSTTTQLAGTLDFLPPELRESNSSLDHTSRQKSDLYAFGKVIYCMVTGKEPQFFPSTPPELQPTLLNRILLRLAFQLCKKEPICRLSRIEDLSAELYRIEYALIYGESWFDHVKFFLRNLYLSMIMVQVHSLNWSKTHYCFSAFLFLLLLAGGFFVIRALWLMPDLATEKLVKLIQEQKSVATLPSNLKLFRFHNNRYSLDVPSHWRIITKEEFLEPLIKRKATPKAPAWTEGTLRKQYRFREAFLLPRPLAKDQQDTFITIFYIPRTQAELEKLTELQLSRVLLPHFTQKINDFSAKYYTRSRSGYPAVVTMGNLSPQASHLAYVYPQKDHSVVIMIALPRKYENTDNLPFLQLVESFRSYNTTPALKGGTR